MPTRKSHQFGKTPSWEAKDLGQPRPLHGLEGVHPRLASEGSDESDGGGAPLWTPASAIFSNSKPDNLAGKSAEKAEKEVRITEVEALHEGLSQISYRTRSKQTSPAASECPPREHGDITEPKQEHKMVRHRHTLGSSQGLGSSLNALTAPFVPSSAQGSLNLKVTQNVGNGQKRSSGLTSKNSAFTHRPASKSLHLVIEKGSSDVPPFPFTERPPIPGLNEMLSATQENIRKTSPPPYSRNELSDYTNGRGSNEPHVENGAELVRYNTSQAMMPFLPPGHVEEHRLRIFATPSEETRRGRSDALNWLTARGVPQEKDLLDPNYIPFMESAKKHSPSDHAVVHLSNIPYGVSGNEIMALMGRSSRQVVDGLEGIHIIMTRIDGKTHDAFVEFENLTAAMSVVGRLERRSVGNSASANGSNHASSYVPRLGDRQVSVNLSSQRDLMKALFPNARGVEWQGARPQFPAQPTDQPWKHFKGFLTLEELSMLVKHVESPQRASFSIHCPERPYENFMSVLKKFPWNETDFITIHMQHTMYDTARRLIEILQDKLDRGDCQRLTENLLTRFVTACLLCPGFTILQKDNVMVTADWSYANVSFPLNMPRFADHWRHQYALCPDPLAPFDVVEFYIGIIREETKSEVSSLTLEDSRVLAEKASATTDYWGYFWREVGFPQPGKTIVNGQGHVRDFDSMSLSDAAQLEWAAVDRILRRALQPTVASA